MLRINYKLLPLLMKYLMMLPK